MKFSLIIVIGFVFLIELASAWPFPAFFSTFFNHTTRIPNFNLDIEHPWLQNKENLMQLWRLGDPKSALCSLSSNLRPSNISSAFTYPADLFSNLKIDTHWHGNMKIGQRRSRPVADRDVWTHTVQQLVEILNCPAALHDVEDLTIERLFLDVKRPSPSAPVGIPDLFVKLLTSMPQLRRLGWTSFGHFEDMLEEAFTAANLTLPSVRYLLTTSGAESMVNMCPGIERLDYKQYRDGRTRAEENLSITQLIQSLDSTPGLKSFSMDGAWKLPYIHMLLDKSPNLTNLSIQNDFHNYHGDFHGYGSASDALGEKLMNYTNALARFPYLEHLWLPDVSRLDIGLEDGYLCGNMFFGAEGRAYGRALEREAVEAIELASSIVLAKIPWLKTLSVGRSLPNITRDESGKADTIWPWTGRLTEHLYEVWSE